MLVLPCLACSAPRSMEAQFDLIQHVVPCRFGWKLISDLMHSLAKCLGRHS